MKAKFNSEFVVLDGLTFCARKGVSKGMQIFQFSGLCNSVPTCFKTVKCIFCQLNEKIGQKITFFWNMQSYVGHVVSI